MTTGVEHSEQTEQSGGVILVPPTESKQHRKSRRFCLTLNNWTEEEYRNIKSSFEAKAKNWIIGKEVGDEGTHHLQIYVDFASPRTYLTIKNMTSSRCHIEQAKGNVQCNWKYCIKDGDFETNIDGSQWMSIQEICDAEILEEYKGVVWKDWQQDILDEIKLKPNDRKIKWVYDKVGNNGKSFLTMWIDLNYTGVIIASGKTADIFNQINQMMNPKKGRGVKPTIVIVDIPRSSLDYINYTAIEKLKDGHLYSGKYEGGKVRIPRPHVICFANEMPTKEKTSLDRWEIIELKKPARDVIKEALEGSDEEE